jgi:hypothetical protein
MNLSVTPAQYRTPDSVTPSPQRLLYAKEMDVSLGCLQQRPIRVPKSKIGLQHDTYSL